MLDQPYRGWIMGSGLETKLTFNKLSREERASLRRQYDEKPERLNVPAADLNELTSTLRLTLAAQANPWETISQSHYSIDDSAEVRTASIAYYGLSGDDECQVVGRLPDQTTIPAQRQGKIVNSHIWPRHAITNLPLFNIPQSDIHNPRNVLRLHKQIERAFDHRKLTLIANENGDGFTLKVLSTDLLGNRTPLNGTTVTFQDIQGWPLNLPSGQFPYRRLLAHHCLLTYRNARTMGWDDSIDMNQAEVHAQNVLSHSLDEEAQRRITLLWRTSQN